MMDKNATIEPKVDVKHEVTIDLCDLSIAMAEEEQDDGELAMMRADAIAKIMNRYIDEDTTIAINSVNLSYIDHVSVDAYEYHQRDEEGRCTVGLSFRDADDRELALWLVDAVGSELKLDFHDSEQVGVGKLLVIGLK